MSINTSTSITNTNSYPQVDSVKKDRIPHDLFYDIDFEKYGVNLKEVQTITHHRNKNLPSISLRDHTYCSREYDKNAPIEMTFGDAFKYIVHKINVCLEKQKNWTQDSRLCDMGAHNSDEFIYATTCTLPNSWYRKTCEILSKEGYIEPINLKYFNCYSSNMYYIKVK